eukprot:755433-Hanusia_phi.AAC.3
MEEVEEGREEGGEEVGKGRREEDGGEKGGGGGGRRAPPRKSRSLLFSRRAWSRRDEEETRERMAKEEVEEGRGRRTEVRKEGGARKGEGPGRSERDVVVEEQAEWEGVYLYGDGDAVREDSEREGAEERTGTGSTMSGG